MLVLTRKVGEDILIGDDITISITRIEDDRVRVAISAPRDVPIFRSEVLRRPKPESGTGDDS